MRTLSRQARDQKSLRIFWRAVGLLAASAAITGNVAAAHAAPPLRDVGPVSTDFASGGSQIAADRTRLAYMPVPGHVRVLDENLRQVAQVAEPGCAWRSFGGDALLWNCAQTAGYPFGYSLVDELAGRQRRVLAPPAVPSGAHGEAPEWAEIGRRWLTVFFDGSPDSRAYVNRATGRVDYRNAQFAEARHHVRVITDPDQDDLTRSVCAPFEQQFIAGDRGSAVPVPLAYRTPYGATRSGSRLVMGRCGARRLATLSRCPHTCSDPVIGDQVIAWTEGTSPTRRTVYVRLADRSRTWRWRLPTQPSRRPVAAVGRRLFVLSQGMLKTIRLPAATNKR
jgi:hypothetical protein